MDYVLRTDNLTKVYQKSRVVNRVSMHVKQGDIYGFIGKNGAGKTTFMRMVAGLAAPTEGKLWLFGSEIFERQRKRIGTLIESPGIYPNMTAKDNLEVVRRSFGITDKHVVGDVLELVGLSDTGKKKAKHFSMGMKQRLGIGISLLRNPDFLILDEPINGLDPAGIKEIRELLLSLNQEREITILISSHILGELSKIATCYGIIRDGILQQEFDSEELTERCRRCQKLVVKDAAKAARILEERLGITSYDILKEGVLRVFEHIDEIERINSVLFSEEVEIRESYLAGQDLEGYFMDLLGGEQDD